MFNPLSKHSPGGNHHKNQSILIKETPCPFELYNAAAIYTYVQFQEGKNVISIAHRILGNVTVIVLGKCGDLTKS